MKECLPDRSQIAREVLSYLSGQSDAGDTIEGIMRHQVPGGADVRQMSLVKDVISDLVTQGRIEKMRKDDRIVYRMRSRR